MHGEVSMCLFLVLENTMLIQNTTALCFAIVGRMGV
jgi:hypothetical protein